MIGIRCLRRYLARTGHEGRADLRARLIASGALVPATAPWPAVDVAGLEPGDISTVLDELREERLTT